MNIGDTLPLFVQLGDYSAGQFVRAFVSDANGAPLPTSPVNLIAADATGNYKNLSLSMPNTPWVYAKFAVYTDNTYTTLSPSEGGNDSTFYLSNFVPPYSNIVGVIDGDQCNDQGQTLQDVILKGSDRVLTVRLTLQTLNGSPFDLTGTTLVEFRFRNADNTVLSLKSTDVGAPVNVVVPAAGRLTCKISATQSLLLAALAPSPFTIIVTKGTVTVVNMPTQLGVEQQDV